MRTLSPTHARTHDEEDDELSASERRSHDRLRRGGAQPRAPAQLYNYNYVYCRALRVRVVSMIFLVLEQFVYVYNYVYSQQCTVDRVQYKL